MISVKNKIIAIIIAVTIVVFAIIGLVIINKGRDTTPIKTQLNTNNGLITAEQINESDLYNKETSPENSRPSSNTTNNQPGPPSTSQVTTMIESSGAMKGNSYGIVSTKNPLPGWWVITIKSNQTGSSTVILKETGNPSSPYAIFAGPGTYFPPETIKLPQEVRDSL